MVRKEGIEPSCDGCKPTALPLSYSRIKRRPISTIRSPIVTLIISFTSNPTENIIIPNMTKPL